MTRDTGKSYRENHYIRKQAHFVIRITCYIIYHCVIIPIFRRIQTLKKSNLFTNKAFCIIVGMYGFIIVAAVGLLALQLQDVNIGDLVRDKES